MISVRETIFVGLVDDVSHANTDPVDPERLDAAIASLIAYSQHVRDAEQVPDPMPAGWNRPAPASEHELVEVLLDVLERVQMGDSFEGFVMWSMPTDEPELESADFGLIARYRIGNRNGQGGMRVYQR